VNRTVKPAIAALVSAIAVVLVIAYVPDVRVKAMRMFRSVGLVGADSVEEGRAASQRGDYATIPGLWRPLAERGDAAAQNRLGTAYLVRASRRMMRWRWLGTERRPSRGMP
jgi:hypothetical protein